MTGRSGQGKGPMFGHLPPRHQRNSDESDFDATNYIATPEGYHHQWNETDQEMQYSGTEQHPIPLSSDNPSHHNSPHNSPFQQRWNDYFNSFNFYNTPERENPAPVEVPFPSPQPEIPRHNRGPRTITTARKSVRRGTKFSFQMPSSSSYANIQEEEDEDEDEDEDPMEDVDAPTMNFSPPPVQHPPIHQSPAYQPPQAHYQPEPPQLATAEQVEAAIRRAEEMQRQYIDSERLAKRMAKEMRKVGRCMARWKREK